MPSRAYDFRPRGPAIDQFVIAADGNPFASQVVGDLVGRGSAPIRCVTESLLQDRPRGVICGPNPNARAIRAYAKAARRTDRLVETPE